jgi:hypothetical protein
MAIAHSRRLADQRELHGAAKALASIDIRVTHVCLRIKRWPLVRHFMSASPFFVAELRECQYRHASWFEE